VSPTPLRLAPGEDLRESLEALLRGGGSPPAFVVAGIGSLSRASIRFAGRSATDVRLGDFEIVSLSGTITIDGAHIHAALADAHGHVFGGHVAHGCIVRTTAEILLVGLAEWDLRRRHDPATGYPELHIARLS
jgi:predicted DNA-binding protein with PD1-like motif